MHLRVILVLLVVDHRYSHTSNSTVYIVLLVHIYGIHLSPPSMAVVRGTYSTSTIFSESLSQPAVTVLHSAANSLLTYSVDEYTYAQLVH